MNANALTDLQAAQTIVRKMTGTGKIVPADELDDLRLRLNYVEAFIRSLP
jgi:hypothetical protein